MKTYALIAVHLVTAVLLLSVACSDHPINKLKGDWVASDGKHILKVTDKTFAIDAEAQITEDYFVKGDTIYTSFEGNQPYTKFAIKRLEDDRLSLLDPDSVTIEFTRK
jgi:hypothetical protein